MPIDPYYRDDECGIEIYLGDCREILPQLPKPELVVTDPPYGIQYKSGMASETLEREIDGDESTELRDWIVSYIDCPALIFGSWKKPVPKGTRMVLIWDTLGALGMGDLSLPWKPSHQQIYVLGRGFIGNRDSDVISVPPVQSMAKNGRLHPHQKPVELMKRLLQKCPTGTVVDPCMGSGSTLVAAKQLGFTAIGMDTTKKYCEIAVNRLRQKVLQFEGD